MRVSRNKFEEWVLEVLETLPDNVVDKLNNVAFFIEDEPGKDRLKKAKVAKGMTLFGLYEGYKQGRKIFVGPVLPDRITLFRQAICSAYLNEEDVKLQIRKTIIHEIAHHLGSDERGARGSEKYEGRSSKYERN